jgi:hypothetical protein
VADRLINHGTIVEEPPNPPKDVAIDAWSIIGQFPVTFEKILNSDEHLLDSRFGLTNEEMLKGSLDTYLDARKDNNAQGAEHTWQAFNAWFAKVEDVNLEAVAAAVSKKVLGSIAIGVGGSIAVVFVRASTAAGYDRNESRLVKVGNKTYDRKDFPPVVITGQVSRETADMEQLYGAVFEQLISL